MADGGDVELRIVGDGWGWLGMVGDCMILDTIYKVGWWDNNDMMWDVVVVKPCTEIDIIRRRQAA